MQFLNIPIQVWVFLIFIAFSGLSALYRKLAAARAQREAMMQTRQSEEETLRTGRTPDGRVPMMGQSEQLQRMAREQVDPRLRDENMLRTGRTSTASVQMMGGEDKQQRKASEQAEARSRQEQRLRELREQIRRDGGTAANGGANRPAMAGNTRPTPTNPGQAGGQPQGVELWPGGPVVIINQPGAAPAGPAGPRPASLPKPPMRTAGQPKTPLSQGRNQGGSQTAGRGKALGPSRAGSSTQQPRPAPVPSDRAATIAMSQKAAAEQDAQDKVDRIRQTAREIASATSLPKTPAQWRTTIVAAEVLQPPLSMR